MKTIVVSGARSGVGKTTLARHICELLPAAMRVKIGHHPRTDRADDGQYYPAGTGAGEVRARHDGCPFLVIESNGILNDFIPDLCLYLGSDDPKPSAARAYAMADIRRNEPCTRERIGLLSVRLGIAEETMRQIAWLAGSRPRHAAAVILAGGRSRRMGSDKAMLDIRGKTMIQLVYDTLAPLFDEVIVAVGRDDGRFGDMRVVEDRVAGQGPLAGMEAAMASSGAEVFFVSACDTPRLDPALVAQLLALSERFAAVAPAFGDRPPEPLFAVYRGSLGAAANSLVRNGVRRASALLEAAQAKVIRLPENDWYVNLNTVAEYSAFLATIAPPLEEVSGNE